MDSRFKEHEDVILNLGGATADRLRALVLNLYNGAAHPAPDLGRFLANADGNVTRIALHLLGGYWQHGENDPDFLRIGSLLAERKAAGRVPRKTRSNYEWKLHEVPARRVFVLKDLNLGGRSVTNDAAEIVDAFRQAQGFDDDDVMIYCDSMGAWAIIRPLDDDEVRFIALKATTEWAAIREVTTS